MQTKIPEQLNEGINFLINQMPGYFIIKDINSNYLKCCSKMAKLIGCKNGDDIMGLTDYNIKHEIAKYGDMFVSQDKRLNLSGIPISGFYTIYYDNIARPFIFNKSFLKNQIGKNISILAHSIEINDPSLGQAIIELSKIDYFVNKKNRGSVNYFLNNQYQGVDLSKRQSQCLFYLLRGKSASTIGSILGLSKRTIESYIDEIKNKMGCSNKSELIERAINYGYLENIPAGIIAYY